MHRSSHTTPKVAFTLALGAGLLLIGMACGGGGGSETGANGPDSESLELSMGDNFFDQGGAQNPTLSLAVGTTIEIALANDGAAIHNMRFAGDDNQFNTADDGVSDPDIVPAGQTATIKFTLPEKAGTYSYQCDFHPTDMKGTIATS